VRVATLPMLIPVAETAAGGHYVPETDHAVQIRGTLHWIRSVSHRSSVRGELRVSSADVPRVLHIGAASQTSIPHRSGGYCPGGRVGYFCKRALRAEKQHDCSTFTRERYVCAQ
jgi:hypothetical protein